MAKAPKRAFVCNECGADYPRWQGQCSACHAWNTITDTGKFLPDAAAVSLKAALGMWVLWPTPYTDLLFETISTAFDPKKGFYECAAPIIMDRSNMTLIGDTGVDNGQVKIRLADGARAPMIVIGTIDSTFKSPIRDRITGTADDLGVAGWDSSFGLGLIDATRALA